MTESQLIDRLTKDLALAGHFVRGVPGGAEHGFIVKDGPTEFYVTVSKGLPALPGPDPHATELLAAARAVLAAREDQMLTATEWERLRAAVENAPKLER